MACYYPVKAFRSRTPTKNGKFGIVFKREDSNGQEVVVSCGGCVGCRLQQSADWALRCAHEIQMTEENGLPSVFITLTYREKYSHHYSREEQEYYLAHGYHLPHDEGLHHEHFQTFIRRLRKLKRRQGVFEKIRFFMCGEYGDKGARPHYHAILFGYDAEDKYVSGTNNGFTLYRSDELETVWPYGSVTLGEGNKQTAGYVARYVMKKQTGEKADDYYRKFDSDGRLVRVRHEYVRCSNRPGIGKSWYDKYKADLAKDFVTLDGKKHKVPAYYDKLLEADDSEAAKAVKVKRRLAAEKHADNNTPERLQVREQCVKARVERLVRPLD